MRKRKAFLVASLVLLLLGMGVWGCGPVETPTPPSPAEEPGIPPPPPPSGGSVEACVFYNGLPVSDAEVSITNHEDRAFVAQTNGCYYFHDVPSGEYFVTAEYKGVSLPMVVAVRQEEQIHLDFWLEEPPPPPPPDQVISCEEAIAHVGEFKTVQGRFYASYRPDVNGEPTFLNCPVPWPDHDFTALIWGDERPIFESCLGGPPEALLDKQEFGVHGLIEPYEDKVEIILTKCDQLREKQ